MSTNNKTQGDVQVKDRLQPPPMYKVILLNDDYTPMDFVVHILKKFFNHSDATAYEIMMQVHTDGAGVAGVYTFEVAEMKAAQVNSYAQKNEHPLKCILEQES